MYSKERGQGQEERYVELRSYTRFSLSYSVDVNKAYPERIPEQAEKIRYRMTDLGGIDCPQEIKYEKREVKREH